MSSISELVERMVCPPGEEWQPARVQVTMRVPGETVWWLDLLASRAGMARSAFAQELIIKGVSQLVEEAEAAGVVTPEDGEAFEDWSHQVMEG